MQREYTTRVVGAILESAGREGAIAAAMCADAGSDQSSRGHLLPSPSTARSGEEHPSYRDRGKSILARCERRNGRPPKFSINCARHRSLHAPARGGLHSLIDVFDRAQVAGGGPGGFGGRLKSREPSPSLFDVPGPEPNACVAALDAVVHEGIQAAVRLAFSMQVRTMTSGLSEEPAGRPGAPALGEHELGPL